MDTSVFNLIFENLLSNAIRYTDNGGTITIELTNQNNELTVKISDTGCGIPEQARGNIFTKHFRAENAKKKDPGGTGLGLYIVKTIADKIGARVWFASQENVGTTFFVALPFDKFRV